MHILVAPVPGKSFRSTVTVAHQEFGTMLAGSVYQFSTTTACYCLQSSAGTAATAADGSMLVQPGQDVFFHGSNGSKLSVLRATADGECTLQQVEPAR